MSIISNFLEMVAAYRTFNTINDPNQYPIAFYSEMASDRLYFQGIIYELLKKIKISILYLTSDHTDFFLKNPPLGVKSIYAGKGFIRNLIFREIKISVFVMTLSDLNNFELKRSVFSVHYVYIFHSLVSTHMVYRHKAFNSYDSLFIVGPHHEKEIRESEALYNLEAKHLVQCGYPRLDNLLSDNEIILSKEQKIKPLILIAPTWGENSISNICIQNILDNTLTGQYQVIYRPHPMTIRDNKKILNDVIKKFSKHPDFYLETNIGNVKSLYQADIMISDWSGVALEYALVTEKPVIFINVPPKINNKKFSDFVAIPVEISFRKKLGFILDIDELNSLPEKILTASTHLIDIAHAIKKLKEDYIYNIGTSEQVGATNLIAILKKK
ncbi:MAG: CDP-glycerol glycerophosphotransferase family protein [Pseudomonadota bacterium]